MHTSSERLPELLAILRENDLELQLEAKTILQKLVEIRQQLDELERDREPSGRAVSTSC